MSGSKSTNSAAKKSMQAYQDAIEFGIDISQLEYLLTLSYAERLKRHDAALAFVSATREAGIQYYGFDPRSYKASE
jgi:hypothetical protein